MSLFNPEKNTRRKLVTTSGVEVNVKPAPHPEPRGEPAPKERYPRAIILPEGQTPEERRGFLDTLCKKHVDLVEELLDRRKDVLEVSRQDLRQRVLLVLCAYVEEKRKVPENMRAFLDAVVWKEVRNHKDRWRPPIAHGADAELVPAPGDEEREERIAHAEKREKLERFIALLPEALQEVVRCADLYGMTIEEIAQALERPPSTVWDHLKIARAKLRAIARASEPAMAGGAGGARAKKPEKG